MKSNAVGAPFTDDRLRGLRARADYDRADSLGGITAAFLATTHDITNADFLAGHYNFNIPGNPQASIVLRSLELNPVHIGKRLVVQRAQCEFGAPPAGRLCRPINKIDKLLHPASIGIIGVSASGMNFGRIILRNLMGSGYSKERLVIIRPGEKEIDGVRCVESLKALAGKLDMLIVAVAASAVYDLVDEIIATDAVESVMLIPGSLG